MGQIVDMKTQENIYTSISTAATINIAGAGPAGLAAAITLAKAGRQVVVHEAKPTVGFRFQGDLQGLENWTTEQDVLEHFSELGMTTAFRRSALSQGTVFDAWETPYHIQSDSPLFYTIERGPGKGSLDHALLDQALRLGVEVRFNSRLTQLKGAGILATGPKAADAIAVGYHFETDMHDGFWAICNDYLAPHGYAYVLLMQGQGTIKTCLFSDFPNQKLYVERTVDAFRKLIPGFTMKNPQPHGGAGNFFIPESAVRGHHPMVGEQAGFQDTLWGFGIRYAIVSGCLAAQSLLEKKDYNHLWKTQFKRSFQTSVVNRFLFRNMTNQGYRRLLGRLTEQKDVRQFLRNMYRPSLPKWFLYPWARKRYATQRTTDTCTELSCECVMCHCEHGA